MRIMKSASLLLLLAMTASLAACASNGRVAKPAAWPTVSPLPQRLLKKTDYAGSVRRELYEPASSHSPSATKP